MTEKPRKKKIFKKKENILFCTISKIQKYMIVYLYSYNYLRS